MIRFSASFWMATASCMILAACASENSVPVERVAVPEGSLAAMRQANAYVPSTEADFKNNPASREFQGQALNLDGFKLTFEDEFNRMSVTDEQGNGPWYSPVHGSFGASKFLPPRDGKGPIFLRDGKLVIQLFQDKGRWYSGNIQTMNLKGDGFAQQYGYFEMRAKFPAGIATWPAFWLHSHPVLTGPNVPQTEIDIVEAYGGDPKGHHAALHVWPSKTPIKGDTTKEIGLGAYTAVKGMFDNEYHTYGALITPENIVFYYDRKELARMKTPPEAKTPQYMLVDLAMLPRYAHRAEGLMEMEVDYVKVWQNPAFAR